MAQIKYEVGDWVELHDDGDLYWIKKEKIIDKISGNNSQFLPEPEEKGPVSIKEAINLKLYDPTSDDFRTRIEEGLDHKGGEPYSKNINKLYKNLK